MIAPACGKYFENGGHPVVRIWHIYQKHNVLCRDIEIFQKKYFVCDPGFKMYRFPDYLEFSHRNMAQTGEKK